jgi:hypothetical protein
LARKSKKDQAKADVETVEEIVKDVVEATETEAEAVVEDISEETLDAVDDHADDAPTEETPEHDYDDHHDDAHHGSFSSKVLTGLVLLGVGGGAALWGGPKLAPMLPSGLAPVAEFFAPGQDAATTQVGALETKLEDRFAALEAADQTGVTQDAIAKAIADYDASAQSAMAALGDKVNAADSTDIEARLSSVETRLVGLTASLDSLNTQLTGQITDGTTALSDDTVAQLGAFQAVVNGLKAEIDALSKSQGSLNQKIDEVEVTAKRQVNEAETKAAEIETSANATLASAETKALLSTLNTALENGAPFGGTLLALTDTPPAGLLAVAGGAAPLTSLQKDFADYAFSALRASDKAASGDGLGGKFTSFLKAQVGTRSLTPQTGDSTDAVLSRIDGAVKSGDLPSVLSEAAALDEAAAGAIAPWVAQVQSLQNAKSALASLTNTLSGQ